MNNQKNKKAFSLIEISVVLLIIAIIVAAIVEATSFIAESKLTKAQILTKNSAVKDIEGLQFWFETSLSESFKVDENGDGSTISIWRNIADKTPLKHATQNSSTSRPQLVFEAFDNAIPALRFDGVDDYLDFDANKLVNSSYSIFVVEKRSSSKSNNYFIAGSSGSQNNNLMLGYGSNTSITQDHYTNGINFAIDGFTSQIARIHGFVFSSTDGKEYYLNDSATPDQSHSNSTAVNSFSGASIGKYLTSSYYQGDIAEIIIFDRAITSQERGEIQEYLMKKYNIKSSSPAASNALSCGSGGVCSPCQVNVVGSSDVSQKEEGSSGVINCDQTGYAGSIAYFCVNGAAISGTCSCATGYALNSGTCQLQTCSVSVAGSSDTTTRTYGQDSTSNPITCDQTGYTGVFSYTCTGSAITGTCGCNTTTHNLDGGTCKQKCTITGQSGIVNNTTVNSGSTSIACNDPNATGGTLTYTCNNGTLSNITNSCVVPFQCTGGDTKDTTTVAGETIHIFTTTGTSSFSCNQAINVRALVVAGGGSGGNRHGGGGGAGGMIDTTISLSANTSYQITVGSGGAMGALQKGQNSSIGTLVVAIGGGRGGNNANGASGGSGGGGSNQGIGGAGTAGQGNKGGDARPDISGTGAGAGGGGAGVAGINMSTTNPTNGGDGALSNITGTNKYYAGGGGGGSWWTCLYGNGGLGGGGRGGCRGNTEQYGFAGEANTGGGGGGGGVDSSASNGYGGAGGSGIVVIRYVNP